MTEFVLNRTGFVLNMTELDPHRTTFILIITPFVLNMIGFVLNMTVFS